MSFKLAPCEAPGAMGLPLLSHHLKHRSECKASPHLMPVFGAKLLMFKSLRAGVVHFGLIFNPN